MENALTEIVHKMYELDFRDDEYRNKSVGNRILGLQYFFKRKEDSSWEVYSSYNPNTGLLSLHYYDIYEDESRYPVFFITIEGDKDAEIACHLLEIKSNYLWTTKVKRIKHGTDKIASQIERMGFKKKSLENNITTWVRQTDDSYHTLIVENGVTLAIYLFTGNPKGKAKPLLALRNIHEENAFEACVAYTKMKVNQ